MNKIGCDRSDKIGFHLSMAVAMLVSMCADDADEVHGINSNQESYIHLASDLATQARNFFLKIYSLEKPDAD